MQAVAQHEPRETPASRARAFALVRRGLAWAAYPVIAILLARYVVVPDALAQWGSGGADAVASRATVAVFGLVMMAIAPALIGFWIARDDTHTHTWRTEARVLARVGIGAALTMAIARVLWVGPGFEIDLAIRLFGFWLAWGVFALGIACALRRLGAGDSAVIAVPALIGFAAASSVFWIDAGLSRALTNTPNSNALVDAAVSWSPFTTYLAGVFEFEIFKSGHMYLNPAGDGGGLSCIGEYMPGGYRYPDFIAWIARWPLLGLVGYALARAWQRFVQTRGRALA